MRLNYKYASQINSTLADHIISDLIQYSVFGVDTETTGLVKRIDKPRLLQIAGIPENCNKPSDASIYVIDLWNMPESFLSLLSNVLNFKHTAAATKAHKNKAGHIQKITFGHNLKFDLVMLWHYGIDITGDGTNVLYDTMLAEQLIKNAAGDEEIKQKGYFSLASVVDRYNVGYKLDKTEQISDWAAETLTEDQIYYAALDAVAPYFPMVKQKQVLIQEKLVEAALLDFKALPAVSAMEYYGVKLNIDKWNALIPKFESETKEKQENLLNVFQGIYEQSSWTGEIKYSLSLSSSSQLLIKLQDFGIPDPDEPSQIISSTAKDKLLRVDNEKYPWVVDIVMWRKAAKAITSFLQPMPDRINPITGRLHTNQKQHGTITGRCSSYGPNLNQVPRSEEFRDCFEAEEGSQFCLADYSSLELRLAAYVFGENVMLDAYKKDINADLHALTASKFNDVAMDMVTKKQRTGGKCSNFLLCLTEDTLVLTDQGEQLITDISVGDKVFTHLGYWKEVLATQRYLANALVKVVTNNGKSVTMTVDHKMYCMRKSGLIEWVKALRLIVGESLFDKDYNLEKIVSIEYLRLDFDRYVYDLTVADDHSFIANGLISHNCYGGGWRLLKLKGKTQYGFDMTAEEAQRNHKLYHQTYKVIDSVHKKVFRVFNKADKKGKWTRNMYPDPRSFSGRRLKLVNPKSPNQVINFPIQGGAGDLGKRALGNLYYHFKSQGYYPTANEAIKIILYVYDEIVMEVKENLAEMVAEKLQYFMEEAGDYYCRDFPGLILADPAIGKTWASKQ